MLKVNIVDKKVKMDKWDIIKYQILTHCYVLNIQITDSELDCLTLLATNGITDLAKLCSIAVEKKIFKSTQTVRNCLVKLEKNNLLIKEGKMRKKISINPDIKIQVLGNILLDYKFYNIESEKAY